MSSALLLTVLLGCSKEGVDTDSGAATGPGTLLLSFELEEDLIPSMSEDPVGDFRGSIFVEDDASSIGPNEGAEAVENITVSLDLSSGEVADAYTTGELEPGIYWILGCLDTDGNDCETDDPITVPNENKFLVEAGQQSAAVVTMSLLNPT
jgi:hypothetical protein